MQLDEQFSDFYSVGPFILYPPSLSKFNQQLWLLSQITNQKHVQGLVASAGDTLLVSLYMNVSNECAVCRK